MTGLGHPPLYGHEFLILVGGSTLIDAAMAWSTLFAPWERLLDREAPGRVVTFPRAVLAAVLTSAVFLFKLPVLILLGLEVFGLVFLAYVDLVILLPMTGLLVLGLTAISRIAFRPWRVSAGARALSFAVLLLVPVAVYTTFVEPFRLQLETATVPVPAEREGEETLRIGVISDIQTARVTGYEHGAVDRLMALAPDLILVPGDLFQGGARDFESQLGELRRLLGKLRAPGGVYFVLGNMDRASEIRSAIEGTEVRLLVNEITRIELKDRVLAIGGVELAVDSVGSRATIEKLESAPGETDLRILLSHYPDALLRTRSPSRIDLVVAGHTHGGQVRLPWLGPPVTLSRVPRRIAAGGYHESAGRRIYVSRGVGCERGQAPRIRFLCPPDISLLEVR